MRVWISILLASLVLVSGRASMADVLELKNGTILNGKYMGGTAATLRFEALSSIQVIETSRIIALTFTTQVSPSSKPATTPPTGKAAPGTVSKPGATRIQEHALQAQTRRYRSAALAPVSALRERSGARAQDELVGCVIRTPPLPCAPSPD